MPPTMAPTGGPPPPLLLVSAAAPALACSDPGEGAAAGLELIAGEGGAVGA